MRQPGIIAIPKAGNVTHVEDNFRSLSIHLTEEDLHDLDTAFPAPARMMEFKSSSLTVLSVYERMERCASILSMTLFIFLIIVHNL